MKNSQDDLSICYPGFFEAEQRGSAIFLRFSGNFFHNSTSFDKRDFYSDYLERLENADEIKSVILHSAYSETGEDEYLQFFLRERSKRPLSHFGFSDCMEERELSRYCNFVDEFILALLGLDKFVIHICGGDLFSQVLNIMLACDHRIISRGTVFHNVFQAIGTVPKGGGIFWMEKMLGHSRTKELLLLQPEITAERALEVGLADHMVESGHLEDAAIRVAEKIEKIPQPVVRSIKRLTGTSMKAFESYLELETSEVRRIGVSSG